MKYRRVDCVKIRGALRGVVLLPKSYIGKYVRVIEETTLTDIQIQKAKIIDFKYETRKLVEDEG